MLPELVQFENSSVIVGLSLLSPCGSEVMIICLYPVSHLEL